MGGTLAFLWPNITEGLGATFRVGRMDDILLAEPRFAHGYPYDYSAARSFLVNIPAARALASGQTVDLPSPVAGRDGRAVAQVPAPRRHGCRTCASR